MNSLIGVTVLHLAMQFIDPPPRYPDIYPALFALFGFCNLLWTLIYSLTWQLFDTDESRYLDMKNPIENANSRKQKIS
jgi:hypothetical protein